MSVEQPELPVTWRPFGARVAGTVSGVLVLVLVIAAWIGFGASIRAQFSWLQLSTLGFLGLLALSVWFALMRSRVTATTTSLIVVNGYRRRDLDWAQVIGVSLRRGAPWATIDLNDGNTLSLIAIQGSDGSRAVTATRQLQLLIAQHGSGPTG